MTDAAPVSKTSIWEDFLEIFYAPSRVFARRGGNDWGVPLLVLIVLTAIFTFATWGLLRPLAEADAARDLAAQTLKQNWTAEQVEQNRAIADKIIGFTPYVIVIFTAIGPILVGLFLWLAGKALGAVELLGEALMIATYSQFPRLVGWVAMGLQGAMLPDEKMSGFTAVTLSPARFMDPGTTSAPLIAMAGRLDLFIVWATVLLAIGLHVKGKISMGQAAAAAFVVWLLGSLATVAPALLKG
jgi:hypothetical protein